MTAKKGDQQKDRHRREEKELKEGNEKRKVMFSCGYCALSVSFFI